MSNSLKPVISVIASAIRPHLWQELYNSLNNSSETSFEIVFVGNAKPEFDLPSNFHYIYSETKPSQCFEIAARNTNGEYLLVVGDDLLFSKKFLDILLANYLQYNDKKYVFAPLLCRGWKPKKGNIYFKKKDKKTPEVGMVTFIHRDTWFEFGGIDRNFTGSYWDHDMKARILVNGGQCILVRDCLCNEGNNPTNLRDIGVGERDSQLLYKYWLLPSGYLSPERMAKFEPFEDKDILTVTQGSNKGWE